MNDLMRKAFEEITYSTLNIAGSHTGHGLRRKENGEYVSDLLEDHWNTFQEGWEAALDAMKKKTNSQYTDIISDGWEKEFKNEQETAEELNKWVCPLCEEEAGGNLYELLATDCGAEFMIEEEETLEEVVKEFFDKYLNHVEESDGGRLFNPVTVSCCRAMMVEPLGELLEKMRELSGAGKNPLGEEK